MGVSCSDRDKKNNDIRLVIDCKVSINKLLIPNTYPLPSAQDLFAGLAGCKVFCSLDLEGAYTQLSLSEKSRKFMVINTIKGLYTYNRLPQGASSSASIFQQVMDQVLQGIEYTYCYLDDVLIAGKNLQDCLGKLELVLTKLSAANIKVNWEKCKFFVTELPYLGHIISEKGLLPCPSKISTIKEAKVPKNVQELKSFLGLINYYHKFIPHLSSKLYYLYNLLKNDTKYVWDANCDKAFEESKKSLIATNFLEFFDPNKPIVVVADASSYGLGGVIAHTIDGIEKPICFTSFSLNSAQKNYPILHLEALALVSTIKKFHKYLYGQKFFVFTDHKPLVGIFGKEGGNSLFVTRLHRYILEISIYNFEIQYRPSAKMGNADFCSRFPLEQKIPEEYDKEFVRSINFTKELPIDHIKIGQMTNGDEFLQTIIRYIRCGWPKRVDKRFINVFSNHQELEIVDECLMYQNRVVIPQLMQNETLKLLHANHAGMVKMKQLARRSVYWYGLNSDIERFVKSCHECNSMAIEPNSKVESKWIPTIRPFSRIHIDFFHFEHHTFLLMVDSYSKWVEIDWMKNGTDAGKVLKKLVALFARFGLPDVLVSDGGPPFNSFNFVGFLERQGIKVFKSPPYHPSSNGQAERLVRTVKEVMKKFLMDPETKGLDLEDQINLFLFTYRNTCLINDRQFPSEKVLSYAPKTLIDLLNPKKQFKRQLSIPNPSVDEKSSLNAPTIVGGHINDIFDNLIEGDEVWYKNHNPHQHMRWLKAIFLKRFSKNTFQITIGNVPTMAHRTQLRVPDSGQRRPNVISRYRPAKGTECVETNMNSEDEGGFKGFSELELERRGTKRKLQALILPTERSGIEPRRSKRLRTTKVDSNFVYK
ncbi:uncharacterized protein K02A2.6-like isoform X1 [Topomyia yanbarensis]|uniref:uncharacterized protein K02A2.6-like isoform X1 n=1 Tax=Topomyia yanbarensis TaxID=2498891 RepID=UPI00273BDC36|nr:uncharacterized protein K02A2.6-like isoform X1 [Topomyia yanbarensis]XP_058819451.1 uncharacterized protein K02A2.6-like isoform X1 [Topomyia yanbarensis]